MFTPIWNSEYDAGEEMFSEVSTKKDEKEEILLLAKHENKKHY